MVKRSEKQMKFARWKMYFPNERNVPTWKRTLRKVVESGTAQVTFREVSRCEVELVWSKAVTYDSAARLVRLAKEETPSFEILGFPTGVADDVGIAADEAAAAATPETKRARQ